MKKPMPPRWIKLELNWGLVGAAVIYWLNNKTPRWLLFLVIIACGFVGKHGYLLLNEASQFAVPCIKAIINGSPETPMLLFAGSILLILLAGCAQHQQLAFNASLQLYRRFGVRFSG